MLSVTDRMDASAEIDSRVTVTLELYCATSVLDAVSLNGAQHHDLIAAAVYALQSVE
jgi:hypothetical protein